ncbi:transcriptional initiation protein Tat [Rothia sp. HMSC069C04]|uniref:transcriptional initiation protein Tat n=1 Tax=Rothia sp. HMSC069C04 TaxID=1739383 RepID=UPI000AD63BB8|nr:transcriptional initiation protein Tat [Rothia sp. HMSC069C04]
MSTYISRRRVVAGAAWAAPVIATSAAVPAFAASLDCVFAESPHKFLRGYSDYRVEEEFTVPANVHRIRFDIFGGGGVSDTGHESGSGARAIGIVEVKPGQTVRVIAGGGSGDARTPYPFGLKTGGPARGGRGYGDGGDAPRFTMPAEVVAEVTKRYPGALNWRELKDGPKGTVEVYGHPGGGASALLIDGEVIAVAGGGGGGGITYSYTSAPHAKHFPAVLDVSVTKNYHPTDPPIRSFAGSGLSTRGEDATTGTQFYTHSLNTKVSVDGGKGGNNGAGGAGAAKPEVPTGSPNHIFSYDSQNNQVLYSSSAAGNAGGSGFKAKGGNGAVAYSYQLDNNDPKNLEVLTLPGGERIEFSAEETAAEFNGYQFACPEAVAAATAVVVRVLHWRCLLLRPFRSGITTLRVSARA